MIALALAAVLGCWAYAAPEVLGIEGPARTAHLIGGPVAASIAAIAGALVVRGLVRANVAVGLALAAVPLLTGAPPAFVLEAAAVGLGIAGLALLPSGDPGRFGGGWAALLRPGPADDRLRPAEPPPTERSQP